MEIISDWELLLLLNHLASGEDSQVNSTPRPKGRTNGKKRNDDFVVDDSMMRHGGLKEVEESILLEVFVAVSLSQLANAVRFIYVPYSFSFVNMIS